MDNTGALILAIVLAIIMVGMGLSLTIDDFKRVAKFPKAVFIGFLNQIILLPLLGLLLINLFDPSLSNLSIAMGVMILAACPGGPTSNMLTLLAKGDVALSVSLTAINSVITIFSIPFIVNFSLNHFIEGGQEIAAPVGQIMSALIIIVAIPLIIGMLIRKKAPGVAEKMDKPVKIASAAVLAIVIIGLVLKEKANIIPYFSQSLGIVLALNLGTMAIGYVTAKILKLDFKQSLTIAIESGNQNGTLAMTIAISLIGDPSFAIVAAVYSLVMFVTAAIPVGVGMKQK